MALAHLRVPVAYQNLALELAEFAEAHPMEYLDWPPRAPVLPVGLLEPVEARLMSRVLRA